MKMEKEKTEVDDYAPIYTLSNGTKGGLLGWPFAIHREGFTVDGPLPFWTGIWDKNWRLIEAVLSWKL